MRLISKHGKTGVVERAMYRVLARLNEDLSGKRKEQNSASSDYLDWFSRRQQLTVVDHLERQFKLLAPYIEMKQVRKGGKLYPVPVPIGTEARRRSLVLRLLVENIRSGPSISLERKLFTELSELRTYKSPLYKKVLTLYEQAYANRAYSHFRF